jgi:HK97 family phage portal protein
MNFIDRFFYNRLKGMNPSTLNASVIQINNTATIQNWEADKFINAYSTNADVYAIVTFLARKAASISWDVYKLKDEKGSKMALKRYKSLSRNLSGGGLERAVIERSKAIDDSEPIEGTPLANLIKQPNPSEGQDQFFEKLFGFRLLSGEGIVWGNDGGSENPLAEVLEMYVQPSQYMDIIPDPEDLYGWLGFNLSVGQGRIVLPKDDLMFWKSWNPKFDSVTRSHLRGQSPIEAAWYIYRLGIEAQKAAADQMANGGAKGALVPKAITGQGIPMVTQVQADQMQQTISRRINNNDQKGTVALLQTPWEYLNFGLSANDMQLIDSMKFSLEQWCRVFGLPVVLFSAENMADNNYQNALRDLVTNTIVPLCCQLRDELNRWLGPRMGKGQYIDFDIMSLPELQKDIDKLVTGLAAAPWLTFDEKRMAMNYEPLGGAFETAYIPSGFIPIDQAGMDLGVNEDTNKDF